MPHWTPNPTPKPATPAPGAPAQPSSGDARPAGSPAAAATSAPIRKAIDPEEPRAATKLPIAPAGATSAPPPSSRPWRLEKDLPGTEGTPSCNPNYKPPRR